MSVWQGVPGPPKEPKIMDQYPKIESVGSIGGHCFGQFGGPGRASGLEGISSRKARSS